MGDFGCHIFDPVFSALGVAPPLTVSAHAESYSDIVHPGWTVATYLFPGTEMTAYDTIIATWRDGFLKPDKKLSPHFTPHSLRHSFASLLLQAGKPIQYVQRQLGHASIELTVGTYGRWLRKTAPGAVDGLASDVLSSSLVANAPLSSAEGA